MSRASRDKGARGEREVVDLARSCGFPYAERTGWRQVQEDVADVEIAPGFHFEVKRQETWCLPAWLRQAYAAAREGEVPVVAFRRRNRGDDPSGRWHVAVDLRVFLGLLAELRAHRASEGER